MARCQRHAGILGREDKKMHDAGETGGVTDARFGTALVVRFNRIREASIRHKEQETENAAAVATQAARDYTLYAVKLQLTRGSWTLRSYAHGVSGCGQPRQVDVAVPLVNR